MSRRYLPEVGFISIIGVTVLTAVEGTWGFRMHETPVFLVFSILMMISLAFTVLDSLKKKGKAAHILSHTGMFLMLSGAIIGAPAFEDVRIAVADGQGESTAYSRDGSAVTLPFTITLEDFIIDFYDDGVNPKQYRSIIDIDGRTLETKVNHPCRYRGWRIYQNDFDQERGSYSVLQLVRDPWLPLVFLGLFLLAAGAFLRLRLDWKSKYLFIAVILTAILFAVISLARINFGTLMPALRSLWFIPHIVLYMIAYSALALSLVFGILSVCDVRKDGFRTLSFKLFDTASSLLLLGMICGAVWAKAAWGNWWTWDAKECWAGVTWLITLLGLHLPHKMRRRDIAMIVCIFLSFAGMQMAWYGVESLPASRTSMHTYK